jgi:F-type H+-transporting ATPase subunit b
MELHISYIDIIGIICCVAVLLWLLNRYLFRPIIQILDRREAEIHDSRSKAEKNLKSIEKKVSIYRSAISKAKEESLAKLKKSVDQAIKEKAKIIVETEKKNDEFLTQKLKEIQEEEVKSRRHLEKKVASLAEHIIDNLLKQ